MSKSFAPNKPKITVAESGFPWNWIAVATGVSAFVFVTAALAFSFFLNTATKAVVGTAAAGVQLVATYGQAILQGMELTLLEGSDANRLTVLNEISKADFSNSPVPVQLYEAAKSNLEHENESIREAARTAVAAMEKSPNFTSTK